MLLWKDHVVLFSCRYTMQKLNSNTCFKHGPSIDPKSFFIGTCEIQDSNDSNLVESKCVVKNKPSWYKALMII
jgi:hypothetical protein